MGRENLVWPKKKGASRLDAPYQLWIESRESRLPPLAVLNKHLRPTRVPQSYILAFSSMFQPI